MLLVLTRAKTVAEPDRPPAHAFLQGIEMRGDRAFDQAEMRQVEFRRIQGADLRDRFQPRFDIQLRRNEGRNRWTAADPHSGNVATENGVVPMINMVMAGVAGSRDRANFELANADDIVVLQNSNAFRRHRVDLSPKPFHFVAVKAGGGSDELCRIDQVGRAARMDVNRRAELREAPGRAGVIEMNMAEENMPDILKAEASLGKLRGDGLEGRFRAGVEKDQAIVRSRALSPR